MTFRLFFVLVFGVSALAKEAHELRIQELRPTQFTAGLAEVKIRRGKIREAREEGKLRKWKKDHAFEIVLGPNGVSYLVDGHHAALALLAEGERTAFGTVDKDYSHLAPAAFWAKMIAHDRVYLRDEHDRDREPRELPSSVSGLTDDSHRSLAWMARKAGAFEKSDERFAELVWAAFLRGRVRVAASSSVKEWKRAVRAACVAARDRDAENLPGFLGDDGECDVSEIDWTELERKRP